MQAGPTGRAARRRGFTLVEVNLAILLVGMGMLVLFGLFPAALSEGDFALQDTHSALFAEYVMTGLRGKTSKMTWEEFQDNAQFALQPVPGQSDAINVAIAPGVTVQTGGSAVQFPCDTEAENPVYVSYLMDVTPYTDGSRVRAVRLWVMSGQYAPQDVAAFKGRAQWYYTELFYGGAK